MRQSTAALWEGFRDGIVLPAAILGAILAVLGAFINHAPPFGARTDPPDSTIA